MTMTLAMELSKYSAFETLHDGRKIEIRAIKPEDRDSVLKGISRTSDDSVYHRFFTLKRTFSESELNNFLNIDFVKEVGLVAVLEEADRPIIAGGRYIVFTPGVGELLLVVEDAYQKQGVGSALMRHLIAIARKAGIKALHAQVLPSNESILKIFERTGLVTSTMRDKWSVEVTLGLR
jgi:GNAT superfamily N-acetyltransferase